MHTIETVQILPASMDDIWGFISRPENLNRITPPDLHFNIIGKVPEKMENGLLVRYTIRLPYFGRRLWVTEMKHIREKHSFVDEQRVGPYRFWYHYHRIRQTSHGTEMLDRVYYRMPFGIIGEMVHRLSVRKMLERIFEYRRRKFMEIFT